MLTVDILANKRLASLSRCTLCYNNEKNVEHLFLNCKFSKAVWNFLRSGCSINDMPKNLNQLWSNWRSTRRFIKLRKASDVQATITYRFLWKEWNNRIFYSEDCLSKEVARTILLLAVNWMKLCNKRYMIDKLQNVLQKHG